MRNDDWWASIELARRRASVPAAGPDHSAKPNPGADPDPPAGPDRNRATSPDPDPATSRDPDLEGRAVARALTELLAERTAEEIIAFAMWQQERDDESYRWDLWGAAYQINRGCSDDSFDYFRGWLMAQGQTVWESAVADPDTLAGHPVVRLLAPGGRHEFSALGCEAMLGATQGAYARVVGGDMDDDEALDAFYQAAGERMTGGPIGDGPAGEDWDFDDGDEVRRRLPRLAALFQED